MSIEKEENWTKTFVRIISLFSVLFRRNIKSADIEETSHENIIYEKTAKTENMFAG